MHISQDDAEEILRAFDKLQMEDLLSNDQWLFALKIMDYYQFLNQEYFYLRDRYGEKKLHKQEPVDSTSMGSGIYPESEARD
jgi:hypothetical protein